MLKRMKDLFLSAAGILYCDFFLVRSCSFSEKRLRKYQYKKLKRLLKTCQRDVPYYRILFNKIKFDVDKDFKCIEDIKKIPVTTKAIVRERGKEFINSRYKKNAIVQKTSGTAGQPLEVLVSKRQWIMEQATVWRQWRWAGYHFRDKMAIVRSYAPKNQPGKKLVKYDKLRNFIYYSPYDLTDQNMGKYLDHMIKEKVKFLRGYPSSIAALAKFVNRTGHAVPKVRGIFTASEVLSDEVKKNIEKAFKAKVSNYYGMAECIVAAGDCGKHKGLHVFEEYGYMEFIDTNEDGIMEIIGTNINNYAMPLLRYETNDLAIMPAGHISCGHTFRTIKNVIGRKNEVIKLKDREIPLTNFYTILEHYPMVLSWQIIQRGQNSIELLLERGVEDKLRDKLMEEFVLRIPEDVQFKIKQGVEFVRSGEGKKPPFMRLDL